MSLTMKRTAAGLAVLALSGAATVLATTSASAAEQSCISFVTMLDNAGPSPFAGHAELPISLCSTSDWAPGSPVRVTYSPATGTGMFVVPNVSNAVPAGAVAAGDGSYYLDTTAGATLPTLVAWDPFGGSFDANSIESGVALTDFTVPTIESTDLTYTFTRTGQNRPADLAIHKSVYAKSISNPKGLFSGRGTTTQSTTSTVRDDFQATSTPQAPTMTNENGAVAADGSSSELFRYVYGLDGYDQIAGLTSFSYDALAEDSDGDGLSDYDEITGDANWGYGNESTDPMNPDTDGDGFTDGDEITVGTNPNDPASNPDAPGTPLLALPLALVGLGAGAGVRALKRRKA